MTSTASSILRLELIGTGEQAGQWGTTTNTNLGTLVEGAIAGMSSVSVTSADQALVATDYATDQARMAILTLTTTTIAAFNVYAPPVTKTYTVYNASSYTATIYNGTAANGTTAAGTGVTIAAGERAFIYSDGTNFYKPTPLTLSLSTGTAAAPSLSFSGDSNTGIYSPGADQISITTGGTARVSVDSSGFVGINRATPSTYLDVAGPAGVTSFTGSTRLGVTVRGATAATDYSGIDFIGNATANPTARIGVVSGGGGSTMVLGTSNNYTTGVTNSALLIDAAGNVGVNTAGPASYGKLVTYNSDNNNGLVVVADTAIIRMKGYQGSGTNSAVIESTTTNQASYQALTLGGSTVALATGGVNRLSIDGSGNATFTGALAAQSTLAVGAAGATATVSGSAPLFMCRAWVNFSGTGSATVNGSGNISSVTRTTDGVYVVAFTTPMPTANYAVTSCAANFSASQAYTVAVVQGTRTINGFTINTGIGNGTILLDAAEVYLAIVC